MRFAKGHGTGNDFVILPDPDGAVKLTPGWVAALCDRRRGIGADGVLRVVRSANDPDAAAMSGAAEWFMDYRNADGSIARLCGNGVRVYARYLVESGLVAADPAAGPVRLRIATRSGLVTAEVRPDTVTADMTMPKIGGASTARVGAREFPGTEVTVGNPNLVCPAGDPHDLANLDLRDPPGLDPLVFPEYANVEFVTRIALAPQAPDGADLHVRMRVYERGAAETLSCGSGACAVAAAALRDAGLDHGTVVVDVPGGRLSITLDPVEGVCRLTGPAVIVATGDLLVGQPSG